MKRRSWAALLLLVVVGVIHGSVQADRNEGNPTPTQQVDAKAKMAKKALKRETYGIEGKDWGVAQTTEIRAKDFHARTPRLHATAGTITTKALRGLLIGPEPPVLIDALGGKGHRTLPGAIWLKGAGRDEEHEDEIDDRLGIVLDRITEGDKTRGMVIFCLSAKCWLSHNTALRAVALGYENVYWYRGGIKAWKKAKLPTERSQKTDW